MKYGIQILIMTALILGAYGCADLKDGIPSATAPGVQAHGAGWLDKASANFHGNAIRQANWDMRSCKTCHGQQYDGGVVDVSCRKCHTGGAGPENCSTCHGSSSNPAPPRDLSRNTARTARGVGGHQPHVAGTSIAYIIPCGECHVVPSSAYQSGHIDGTPNAEVAMTSLLASSVTNEPTTATYSPDLPLFAPSPAYDANALTCASTYCHGNFKNGNPVFAPVWTDASGTQMTCGTCHGDITKPTLAERALPRTVARAGTHPNVLTCFNCHGDVVDASLRIIDPVKHVNGKLNLFGVERDF